MICGAAAVLAAVSCSDKENPGNTLRERIPMEFSAGTPALTRTAIADDGKSVVWSENDAIGIFDGQTNRFDIIEGAGSSAATFSGSALPDVQYYALYPYDGNASITGNTISATLPSVQYSTADGTFDTMLNPAVAKAGEDNSLAFDHVAAMLKVNVEGVTGAVRSVTLSADRSLAGAYTVDMSRTPYSAVAAESETVATVSLVAENDGNLAAGPYYLVVLPGSYSDLRLTVTMADGTAAAGSLASLEVAARDIREVTVTAEDFPQSGFGFATTEDLNFSYKGASKTYTVDAPEGTAWTISADNDDVTVEPASGTGSQEVKVTLPYSKYIYAKEYTLTLAAAGQESKTLTVSQESFASPVGTPDIDGATMTANNGTAYVKSKDFWKHGTFIWNFSKMDLTSGYFDVNNWGSDGIVLMIRCGGKSANGTAENQVGFKGTVQIYGKNLYWGVDTGWGGGWDYDFKYLTDMDLSDVKTIKFEIIPDVREGNYDGVNKNCLSRKLWINDVLVFEFSKTNYPETETNRPGDPAAWCGADIWQSGGGHPGLQYQFGIGGTGNGTMTIDSFEYIPYTPAE